MLLQSMNTIIDNNQNSDSIRFYAHLDICDNINVNVKAKDSIAVFKGACCLAGNEEMSVTGTSGVINGQTVKIPNPSICTDKLRIVITQKNGKLKAVVK